MPYIEIGPVPGEENCAQVGSSDYTEASLRECEVFRRMLARLFEPPRVSRRPVGLSQAATSDA